MHDEKHNGWQYDKIEHWPPLTCRTCSVPTPEALAIFTNFLKTENSTYQNKELQPWIPFCDSKCAFCYFPVNCEKQIVDSYLEALKKAAGLDENIIPYILKCVESYCSIGEISNTLRSVWGEY